MKKKKNIILVCVLLIVILVIAIGYWFFTNFYNKPVEEAKVVSKIDGYNYNLYDNQTKNYKELFEELNDLLTSDSVDEEKYVELISKMFIIDFYTLDNKLTNLNIGGVDFVHSSIVSNFKEKANDTIYKYVKSNIYGDRKQELPIVDEVTVENIEQKAFKYDDTSDSKAYYVKVKWTYKKDLGYEENKTLIFVHEDKKLSLVEMS
ncbi:MAG: hypothetical protein ACI4OG_01005 [Bacilli bacterium]